MDSIDKVKTQLIARNFFHSGIVLKGARSLCILQQAEKLQDIIVRIEKHNGTMQYDFKYQSETNTFIRLGAQKENLSDYLQAPQCQKCCHPCYKAEYSVEEFLILCKHEFEPIEVRWA